MCSEIRILPVLIMLYMAIVHILCICTQAFHSSFSLRLGV
ncbi:hypothetical protein VCHA34P115_150114 [Vibrio chagasii]|nr:hypothetical protein VCHA34P115_150114 [Vibrio chagasii]